MIAIYMLAAFGAAWQYCSYRRINLPLLKIIFCFHTASAKLGRRKVYNDKRNQMQKAEHRVDLCGLN